MSANVLTEDELWFPVYKLVSESKQRISHLRETSPNHQIRYCEYIFFPKLLNTFCFKTRLSLVEK